MSTPSFKGQQCIWGTGDLGTPVANGICTSGSIQHQGQTDAVEDENGARTGMVFYDETYSVSLTVVCKSGCTAPAIGAALTVGTLTVYVTDCREEWQNKGKKQLSITAEGGANIAAGNGAGA